MLFFIFSFLWKRDTQEEAKEKKRKTDSKSVQELNVRVTRQERENGMMMAEAVSHDEPDDGPPLMVMMMLLLLAMSCSGMIHDPIPFLISLEKRKAKA